MSHAKIEWLVSKCGTRSELCQYKKNLVMKRHRRSIEIICEESNNIKTDLTDVTKSMRKGKLLLVVLFYSHTRCCFAKNHCRVPVGISFLLTTRGLEKHSKFYGCEKNHSRQLNFGT